MKPLRRTTLQAVGLLALSFVLITLNVSLSTAQEKPVGPIPPQGHISSAIRTTVTVRDSDLNYVKGLVQSNFTVSDGKQELQIKSFSADDLPLSVGLIVDAASPVRVNLLKVVQNALQRFFQLSNESNEYFLIGFNNGPKLLQDWTSKPDEILKQIDAMQPNKTASVSDASYLGVTKVLTGRNPKRVVILFNEGTYYNSRREFSELKRLLEESDVLLYSIGLQGEYEPGSTVGMEGAPILYELSTITGGRAMFRSDVKQLYAAFDMLAIELRNQYLIGFAPTTMDGKLHSLKVRVTTPSDAPRKMKNLDVRSRKSFYAKRNQP